MLVQLNISNLAIISHLEIRFKPGLNILSGETGAGKSIIINAVNLIVGGRASAELIRSGATEAHVEAMFHLPESPSMKTLLADLGFPYDGEVLIKRTIFREGKNRITINGSGATLHILSRVGGLLISISGQHEHQVLLKPDTHLYFLDDFGGLTQRRLKLDELYGAYQSQKEKMDRLEREIRDGEERRDFIRFQINEIDTAHITPGEDLLLEQEKKRLMNAERLMEIITSSYSRLYEADDSVLSAMTSSVKKIEEGEKIDHRLHAIREGLHSARIGLEEAILGLRDFHKEIIVDPGRLEAVEERLQLLNRLKKKYGPTLEDIMRFQDRLSHTMDDMDQKRAHLEEERGKIEEMKGKLISLGRELSERRKEAAKNLERSVKEEVRLLDMGQTRFEVGFAGTGIGFEDGRTEEIKSLRSDGFDRIEFFISPNVGEDLKPLSKIASGGELSRIMLALKTILAKTGSVETIIFDEVDSGIGGATAEVVGEKLLSLSSYHQILCITHLPQIASKGQVHFQVKKRIRDERTVTTMSELGSEERVKEIARLLGGKVITQKAMAHAREMLG